MIGATSKSEAERAPSKLPDAKPPDIASASVPDAVMAKVVRWLFLVVGALLGMLVVLSLMRGTPLLETVPLLLILFGLEGLSDADCGARPRNGRHAFVS